MEQSRVSLELGNSRISAQALAAGLPCPQDSYALRGFLLGDNTRKVEPMSLAIGTVHVQPLEGLEQQIEVLLLQKCVGCLLQPLRKPGARLLRFLVLEPADKTLKVTNNTWKRHYRLATDHGQKNKQKWRLDWTILEIVPVDSHGFYSTMSIL